MAFHMFQLLYFPLLHFPLPHFQRLHTNRHLLHVVHKYRQRLRLLATSQYNGADIDALIQNVKMGCFGQLRSFKVIGNSTIL